MSVSDETRQREALDRAVIEAAEAWKARIIDPPNQWADAEDHALIEALDARTAALAPPLPPRRQWIVETEHRLPQLGERFVDRGEISEAMFGFRETRCDVLVSVEPFGVNTVTLKPGQYVVEARRAVEGERWFDGESLSDTRITAMSAQGWCAGGYVGVYDQRQGPERATCPSCGRSISFNRITGRFKHHLACDPKAKAPDTARAPHTNGDTP